MYEECYKRRVSAFYIDLLFLLKFVYGSDLWTLANLTGKIAGISVTIRVYSLRHMTKFTELQVHEQDKSPCC